MPDELKARLDAAGVSDNASLLAALKADPDLNADFQAFLESNADALATATMNQLLQVFAAVTDGEQMVEFYRSVPSELEQPLIEAVEAIIEQATAAGDDNTVQNLSERLAVFRQLCETGQQPQEMPPVMRAVLGFFQADDNAAAEQFFADQRTVLQPDEAQQVMDALVEQAPTELPAEMRQRLIDRQASLRRLRGAAPTNTPAPS